MWPEGVDSDGFRVTLNLVQFGLIRAAANQPEY